MINVIIDNQDLKYFQNYEYGVMERLMENKFLSENGIIREVFYIRSISRYHDRLRT